MKVLLTGANGQLGRALLRTAESDTVIVAVGHAELDIGNAEAVEDRVASEKPDLVINAAAYTAVDKAESEAEAAYRTNADGARLLAEAALRNGARMVQISTDFVFDGQLGRPYRPDDLPSPLGVYGASKLAGEQAVLAVSPGALIVRTAWVYAAEGRNFVLTMLRLMRERGAVRVVDDQIGTPTHAESLARAVWRLIAAKAHGVHHFTDAGIASWYDLAVAIAEEGEKRGLVDGASVEPIPSFDYPTPAARPSFGVLDKTASWAFTGKPGHWRQELCLMLDEIARSGRSA